MTGPHVTRDTNVGFLAWLLARLLVCPSAGSATARRQQQLGGGAAAAHSATAAAWWQQRGGSSGVVIAGVQAKPEGR